MHQLYLTPTYFVDNEHPDIVRFSKNVTTNAKSTKDKAIALYYAVRDSIRYNPYDISLAYEDMKASSILNRDSKQAYCVEKACLFNACLRAVGIPSRFHFFDVRNHIGVEKLIEVLHSDILVFHACSEVYLDGKWVKATPAFNKELCEHLGVEPLEFDGENDSIFQEYNKEGKEFMDYVKDHGVFHDVPHDMFVKLLHESYPHFFVSQEEKCMIK